ncbi:heterokaryon incompatibility [Echria macrotheca]|uniref:Heterokaryon incompatibility n=1 Tax=Echria macrotheca TaxID=438768 RepID=A0AAJ0BN33_9PEZI|nr:heterokaryon incompatibility [Echria macrotheca]
MGDIYRQAYRVLVWLRDADPDATPKVMPLLAALADAALARAAKAGTSTSRDCMLDNIPNYMIERADVDDPLADKYRNDMTIMHLVASHWWYRAWTLQEILLAQDALVVIGTYTIEWWRFCAAVNHGFNIGIWAPLTMGVILDGMVLPYISVQHLQRRRARRHLQATNAAQELLEFLNSTRFRLATNPRDKIYALLGLVGNEGAGVALPELRPDYAMSVSYVYRQAAQQLILVSGTLDLVGSAGPIVDHTADPDLPSWVPDWRYTAMVCMPLMHDALGRRRTTHATRRSTVRDPFADAGRTLLLAGHEVTTITAVAPVLRRIVHRSDEFDDLVAGWEAEANAKRGRLSAVYLGVSILVQIFTIVYESLIALVPHLAIFSDWEAFASAANPTNPIPHNAVVDTEPSDPLAIYWQTLCVGTYVASSTFAQSAASLQDPAPATGADKTATQNLFYLWRATLKPIRDLHRWRVDRMFRPLAFLGYVRKTWRNYGEFTRLLEGAYERRLARGANGYLCLVPASAEVGDKIVLARGGRVPLVLRVGKEVDGAHSFIGEAYVHGIMDGDVWAEEKAVPIRVR